MNLFRSCARMLRAFLLLLCSLSFVPVALADESTTPAASATAAVQAPADTATASADAAKAPAIDGVTEAASVDAEAEKPAAATNALGLSSDLSPWGMYQGADIVVKAVMIGLVFASILTWTIGLAKALELLRAKRRLRRELAELKQARSLNQALDSGLDQNGVGAIMLAEAQQELQLSARAPIKEGVKDRVNFRLERVVAASGRQMSVGTGILATIGSTSPFVGLFGTVWGIMNSFIGIAQSQTTNLAVVAPGIAEALLATAIGLVAAIPAVILYNVFARSIGGYRAEVSDSAAQVALLVSRDLDLLPPGDRANAPGTPHVVKAG